MKVFTKKINNLYPKIKLSDESYEIIPSGSPEVGFGESLLSPTESRWGQLYRKISSEGVVVEFELPNGIYSQSSDYFPVPQPPFTSSYTSMIRKIGDKLYIGLGLISYANSEGNRFVGTYDLKSGEWNYPVLSMFPKNLYSTSHIVFDETKILVTGIYDWDTTSYIPDTYVCDLEKGNTWKRMADRDEFSLGTDFSIAVIKHGDGLEYIHTFSGYSNQNVPPITRHLKSHHYYDPREDIWVELPELPERIKFPYFYYTETEIYLFGGSIDVALEDPILNTNVYRYTFASGWEVVGQADLEAANIWHHCTNYYPCAIVDGKAYFEGYEQIDATATYIHSIDVNTFELEYNVLAFPNEDYGGNMVEVDGAIFYTGSYAAPSYEEAPLMYFIKVR
jgi:hypothetical protein